MKYDGLTTYADACACIIPVGPKGPFFTVTEKHQKVGGQGRTWPYFIYPHLALGEHGAGTENLSKTVRYTYGEEDMDGAGLGPYFNLNDAARYCGYAPSYFSRLLKANGLPRYGKAKTRFSKTDLDRFMADHDCFCVVKLGSTRTPKALVV